MSFGHAAPVDRATAARKAKAFMESRHGGAFVAAPVYSKSRVRKSPESVNGPEASEYYYVFSDSVDGGFVIVAGDDRVRSILGYSDTGRFDAERMPDNCRAWLEGMEGEIDGVVSAGTSVSYSDAAGDYPQKAVAPLLTVRWDQGSPYNILCPETPGGQAPLTGCVATAISQIMYYYKYPERPEGNISYMDNKCNVTRTMDFAAQPVFDWNNMLPVYNADATEAQRNAVAQLMVCAGYGVQTQYATDVSTAYHKTAGEALYKYFGYDSNIHRYERNRMTDAEWVEILTGELYANRPVLYNGNGMPDANGGVPVGHAFVCDGYDGAGMFHFNWGWSGMCNGYFSLSALSPEEQGAGGLSNSYTYSQAIECHIQPPGTGESVPQTDGLLFIDALYSYVGDNYYKSIDHETINSYGNANTGFFFYCWNGGHRTFTGEVCAAVIIDGDAKPIASSVQPQTVEPNKYARFQLPVDVTGMENGTYHIGFFCRNSSADSWHRIGATLYNPSESYVTVENGNVAYGRLLPYPHLRQETIGGIPEKAYTGVTYNVDLMLVNDGDARAEGRAGLMLRRTDSQETTSLFTEPIFIIAGETAESSVVLDLKGVQPGEYTIVPVYSLGTGIDAASMIHLSDGINITVNANPYIGLNMSAGGMLVADKPSGRIDVSLIKTSSIAWEGYVAGRIESGDADVCVVSEIKNFNNIGSMECSLYGDLSALSAGVLYDVEFYLDGVNGTSIGKCGLVLTDTSDGVEELPLHGFAIQYDGKEITVSADKTVEELSLTDMAGRRVASGQGAGSMARMRTEELPAGIYIIGVRTGDGRTASVKYRIGHK